MTDVDIALTVSDLMLSAEDIEMRGRSERIHLLRRACMVVQHIHPSPPDAADFVRSMEEMARMISVQAPAVIARALRKAAEMWLERSEQTNAEKVPGDP